MRVKLITVTAILLLANARGFSEQIGEYFREDQNIGQVRAGAGNSSVSEMASLLPYAYYPSKNQMEVAFALSPELLKKTGAAPGKVEVRIHEVHSDKVLATGIVPLDKHNHGQAVFSIPDLPDGEYAVEYVIGKHTERSPKTFKRIHFPFEKTSYGETHEVYPPFEPVKVNSNTVAVVGRSYTLNEEGLFNSVVSLGRELLAAPMNLVAEGTDGNLLKWNMASVQGEAIHPDEAVFKTEANAPGIRLQSVVTVQEDGCAKIRMTLFPAFGITNPTSISHLYLDIPLKDSEVPLFHYIADNAMRFNYAGITPRGGKIEWYAEKWDGWVPLRWRVTKEHSTNSSRDELNDNVIWTSANTRLHPTEQAKDHRPFVPYIWLGAEERGLAFFMESEKGFSTDYRTPLQKIFRDGDRVVLRVEIFQQPVTLNEPRTFTFGFMASPGKPMEEAFRNRAVATGVGPVICWGGWQCASKYPDNHDWSIVDKIQEIRHRGKMTKEDESWFAAKNAEVKARWPERLIQNDPKAKDWLAQTVFFAKRAAEQGRVASGVYFEEHATDTRLPEWEVFQDEWASSEFNRFREKPANWGAFSPSYQNFTLYMANEWMQRGVSLYFDNTNPKRCYNERFGPAYRSQDGVLRYGLSIFGQRDYYRRIFKLRSQWNARGVEYPIDVTLHVTSTQTLPFNTWANATLDLEQQAQTEDPDKGAPELSAAAKGESPGVKPAGYQLPWPPDYTRTVTFGRQAGVIPVALDFVSGHTRKKAALYTPEIMLRNWSMCRIHDIRGFMTNGTIASDVRRFDKALLDFGYGKLDKVEHHSYWEEKPFVKVSNDRIKWLALTQRIAKLEPYGLLLLQSYTRAKVGSIQVDFPDAAVLQDIKTGETIPVIDGHARIAMSDNFSTRMFLVSRTGKTLSPNPQKL